MWALRVWCVVVLAGVVGCGDKKSGEGKPRSGDPAAATDPTPVDKEAKAETLAPEKPAASLPSEPGNLELKHLWSRQIGGEQSDDGRATTVDGQGNAIVTGFFTDQAKIGDETLTATGAGEGGKKGQMDAYVLKLDKSGKPVFTAQLGGTGQQLGASVAADSKGNIVVVGWFGEQLVLGEGTLDSAGSDDIYVVKFAPDGRRLWAKQFGGAESDSAYDVAIDSSDHIYITGDFQGTATIGNQTLTSAGMSDIYLLKLDAEGETVWVKQFGDRKEDFGRSLTVGPGGVVLLGEFSLKPSFGGEPVQSLGNRDMVVAKFTESGQHRWSKRFGTEFDDLALAVTVDPSGAVGVTGSYEETLSIGTETLRADGKGDVLVFRLDQNGETLWARGFGGPHGDVGFSIASDQFGNLYVAGWFWSKMKIGDVELKSAGKKDAFLVKMSPDGKYLWGRSFGGKEHDKGASVAVAADNQVTLSGTFRHTVNFGGADIEYAHAKDGLVPLGDAFVVRFTQ